MASFYRIWQFLKAVLRLQRVTAAKATHVEQPQQSSACFAETKAIADANLRAAEAWQVRAETGRQAHRARWAEMQAQANRTQELLEQSHQDRLDWVEKWQRERHESQIRFDALLEQCRQERQRFDQEFAEMQRAIQSQLEEIQRLRTGEAS